MEKKPFYPKIILVYLLLIVFISIGCVGQQNSPVQVTQTPSQTVTWPVTATLIHPTPLGGISPSPTLPPTQTPIPVSWKTYHNPGLGISLRYPEYWSAENANHYSGQDGYFEINTISYKATVFGTLRTLCILEANREPGLYGEAPLIADWQGWVPELESWIGSGCSVSPFPSDELSGEAVLYTRYTSDPNQVLVLRADSRHFMGMTSTLRMANYATPTPSLGVYRSPLCVLSIPSQPVISHFAGLTVTEYPIVDAACHPYHHLDSFQPRVDALGLKMDPAWLNQNDTHRADTSNHVQIGQDSIMWQFEEGHLFPVGAPSQLDILRNNQVEYRLAVPQFGSGGGPVKAFWSWNGHWILELENVIVIDGEIQNQKLGYDEMFEWHLVNEHPFYFFRQKDKFGIVYNDQEIPKQYDELIHGFLCCDPARYLLQSAPLGARFYAQRDGTWWYVVIKAKSP